MNDALVNKKVFYEEFKAIIRPDGFYFLTKLSLYHCVKIGYDILHLKFKFKFKKINPCAPCVIIHNSQKIGYVVLFFLELH